MKLKDCPKNKVVKNIKIRLTESIKVNLKEGKDRPVIEGYLENIMGHWFLSVKKSIMDFRPQTSEIFVAAEGKENLYLLGDEFWDPTDLLECEVIED